MYNWLPVYVYTLCYNKNMASNFLQRLQLLTAFENSFTVGVTRGRCHPEQSASTSNATDVAGGIPDEQLHCVWGTIDVLLVAASVVQTFHLTPYAVARSLASQQMGEDEQGRFHIQSFLHQ